MKLGDRTARISLTVGLGTASIIALVAVAVVFSIARGTANVGDLATAGIYEEASMSAAAAARNRTVQAQLLAEVESVGVATASEVSQSLERVESAVEELRRRTVQLVGELDDRAAIEEVTAHQEAFAAAVAEVTGLIRRGDLASAEIVIDDRLDASYTALISLLAGRRDDVIAHVEVLRDDAGRLADAARFLVVLLLPLGVILAFRTHTRNEQRRRELEQQLEKQQAVTRAKDEFIANLSHELRTPLTGIYGFALELIGLAGRRPELSGELARLIAAESSELSRMVEDLLATATADRDGFVMSMSGVDPAEEVDEVLAPLAVVGVKARVIMENALITADRTRLRQVICNLVSNADRHGGPDITISGRVVGDRYVIEVGDNGPGVPAELEERMFKRFVHEGDTPLVKGSVGLGLSVARVLTERMGGTITYRRENGETRFSVTLPQASQSHGQLAPATAAKG